jgi:hypothetical protein
VEIYIRDCLPQLHLIVHPSLNPVPSKLRSEAKARRAHGEIANEIPDKTDHLRNGRYEREDGRVKLIHTQ